MPNWCYNNGTINGTKEQIDEFESFLKKNEGKNWFDFFAPTPEELQETTASFNEKPNEELIEKYGASDWYSWNVSNWGTKWNADASWDRSDETSIHLSFDTAWSPPIELYNTIQEKGFVVEMEYCEEGMCFVGEYIDGCDESYEFSNGLSDLDDIPEHLVENWNLRENLESWDEDEDEEFSEEETVDDLQKEFEEWNKKEN